MNIDEIRKKYSEGFYDYKCEIPLTLPNSYIFDEDLSIKRNRELVAEHNANVMLARVEKKNKQEELFKQLREDVVTYIKENYNFSNTQARLVEQYAYLEKHSFMSDYFSYIDSFASFVEDLINS